MDDLNIDLWIWETEATPEFVARWRACLSADEIARVERFRFEQDQNRFVVCRSRMRRILGWYLGVAPRDVRFRYGENQKPYIADRTRDLFFNLSHTEGLACLAVSRDGTVGVDVEKIRPVEADFIAYVLNPAELSRLDGLQDRDRVRGFFGFWTGKEAFTKAQGDGLMQSLKSFDVAVSQTLSPGQFVSGDVVRIDNAAQRARSWKLLSFTPRSGYVGALVCDRSGYQDVTVNCRAFSAVCS